MAKPKMKDEVDVEEKEAYISRELGAILINYETSKYYETNDTGTFIIKLLDGSKNIEEIAEAVHQEYDIDLETILADLNEYIKILKNFELIDE